MEEIPSGAAAKSLGQILERVSRGETIMITRYGRPYALLTPPPREKGPHTSVK